MFCEIVPPPALRAWYHKIFHSSADPEGGFKNHLSFFSLCNSYSLQRPNKRIRALWAAIYLNSLDGAVLDEGISFASEKFDLPVADRWISADIVAAAGVLITVHHRISVSVRLGHEPTFPGTTRLKPSSSRDLSTKESSLLLHQASSWVLHHASYSGHGLFLMEPRYRSNSTASSIILS